MIKMSSSPSQFEMLVTFMEQHGDLCKLTTSNARGRKTNVQRWEELTALLNSDGAGATKTTEMWKKAWNDFKNSTKVKAARLHRAARHTCAGPAVFAKLSDFEQRVLNLMGVQMATGLALEEAGLSQEIHLQPGSNNEDEQGRQILNEFEEFTRQNLATEIETMNAASLLSAISSPPLTFVVQEVQETNLLCPTRPSSLVRKPTPAVLTTLHCARSRTRGTLCRRGRKRIIRPPHTSQAARCFLQADSLWRTAKEQQNKQYIEFRRDQKRITEMEEQVRRDWQALGARTLNLLEKIVDKFSKD